MYDQISNLRLHGGKKVRPSGAIRASEFLAAKTQHLMLRRSTCTKEVLNGGVCERQHTDSTQNYRYTWPYCPPNHKATPLKDKDLK